ncbi:PpiC-type peptidyl-prolyl cis-trans isomerase [Chloroherpeton thalassium ATCC 35110]|uniref:Periplasmic chaperone PpiD n=2 Tax=Chloroherpeton thalassium TaxID=100716 RepID=B3QUQ9_CHLT3|nr:PpiC-type peptidyl-prolyl cis-trans isomerase [Chloroherpeton thalassium ATCC 35110]
MNKMRDSMHIVLYALVGAFVLLIVFEWGMDFTGLNRRKTDAGVVNGKPISLTEYDATYRRYLDGFRQRSNNVEISEQMDARMRDQAWDFLVSQILLDDKYEELGLFVTDEEIVSEVMSDDPPAIIAQQFRDPKTGKINTEALQAAIASPENKEAWIQVEDIIRQELLFKKLQNLVMSGVFVTDDEARRLFDEQNTKVSGRYILFELAHAKADSLYEITEADIRNYFNEHKEDYKQDPVREANFVMFSTAATTEDTLEIIHDLEALKPKFQTAKNDTEFVELQSDRFADFVKTYRPGKLDAKISRLFFDNPSLKVGDVVGPFQEFSEYKIVKILAIDSDEDRQAHASHILLKPEGARRADTLAVMAEAKQLMRELTSDEKFAEVAREKSDDPGSAQKGGDLGWFGKGRMVKEFEDAVFHAKPGQIVGPIQSQFGIHIIKVHGFEDRAIRGAELVRKIKAGPATLERVNRQADEFQYFATEEGFEKTAKQDSVEIQKTGEFTKNGFIPSIGFNRSVSNFAFHEEVGAVSPVISTQDAFVIMQLTGKNDDGYRKLDEDLKNTIREKVLREKKMADLREKAKDVMAKADGNLQKAIEIDSLLTIHKTNQVMLTNAFVPGLGRDKNFVAALSALDEGKVSNPIETKRGVAIAELTKKIKGFDSDFEVRKNALKDQILQEKKKEVMNNWLKDLKESAKIEDLRTM